MNEKRTDQGNITLSNRLRPCVDQTESDRDLTARAGKPEAPFRKTMKAKDLPGSLQPFTEQERQIVKAISEADMWVLGQSGVVSSDKEALEKAASIRLLNDVCDVIAGFEAQSLKGEV